MKQSVVFCCLFILCIGIVIFISSCTKDKVPLPLTDEILYNMARSTNGFIWFKNSDTLFNKSSGSGHAPPYLRTRFNSIAAAKLDAEGKIIPEAVFPEGSLIVKELFADPTTIERYAVLYKSTNHQDADSKGWVWGYINADGSVASPASNKGSSCINCHSQEGNIDYMLMNKYFP